MKNVFKIVLLCMILAFVSCSQPKPFVLVLLPDTQAYTSKFPESFKAQTEWITAHADSIAFVLQQGDITDGNADYQWINATDALFLMDGKVPYTFVMGNHDLGDGGSSNVRNSDLYNHYLPYEKYSKTKNFGGTFETGKMDNTWHTFTAGGINWMILSLEFGPRNCVLDWAGKVIEKHPKHKVIINTHAYMYSDNTRMTNGHNWLPQAYGLGSDTGDNAVNNGEQMWEKMISLYPNVMFVFSGHVLYSGTGTLVSEGVEGNKVYQMLANYQWGVDGIKGDEGYLRIVTIDPVNCKIDVKTYSPHLDKYQTTSNQQFTFNNVDFK